MSCTVFISSARISILTRNTAQLNASLSALVPGLYRALDDLNNKGKSKAQGDDFALSEQMYKLDVRDDERREMASLLLLFQLVHADSRPTFYSTSFQLTQPSSPQLRTQFLSASSPPDSRRLKPVPFISQQALHYANRAAKCMSLESFNPIEYFRLLDDTSASPYERIILSWAQERVRQRAWEMVSKGYLDCGLRWVSTVCGMPKGDVESWTKMKGKVVVDGRVKMR
jgi:hypothetical protein